MTKCIEFFTIKSSVIIGGKYHIWQHTPLQWLLKTQKKRESKMTAFEKAFKEYFTKISNDIIDNYEKYTLKDRIRVFKLLQEMIKVNTPLNSYDCKEIVTLDPKEKAEEQEKHDKYFR
jgi:hypothetical protein